MSKQTNLFELDIEALWEMPDLEAPGSELKVCPVCGAVVMEVHRFRHKYWHRDLEES